MVDTSSDTSMVMKEKSSLSQAPDKLSEISKRNDFNEATNSLSERRAAAPKRSLLKIRPRNRLSSNEESKISPQNQFFYCASPLFSDSSSNDVKRGRPELANLLHFIEPSSRCNPAQTHRMRNLSAPSLLEPSKRTGFGQIPLQIVCQTSLLQKSSLRALLQREMDYHPNNAFLFYVDPVADDKVDATLRNEAVHNLRFIHGLISSFSGEIFCKAVNLIDRFIVKVKVKPKYISCVAVAAYYIAASMCVSSPHSELPNPEVLVKLSRCGGTVEDLFRMKEIIAAKLNNDLEGVNAYDFLNLFAASAVVLSDIRPSSWTSENETTAEMSIENLEKTKELGKYDELFVSDRQNLEQLSSSRTCNNGSNLLSDDPRLELKKMNCRKKVLVDFWRNITGRIVVALCSLDVYQYRPVTLALGILESARVSGISEIARSCNIPLKDVQQCSYLIGDLYEGHWQEFYPQNHRSLIWNLSRRALFRIGCSSPTPLDTISEDCENDKDAKLHFTFEP